MGLTKLQMAIAAVVACGGVIGLVSQQHTIRLLQESDTKLKAQLAALNTENATLAKAHRVARDEVNAWRAPIAEAKSSRPVVDATSIPTPLRTKADSTVTNAHRLASPPDTPENRQRKAKYHERYDPFFSQHGYKPPQIERIMDLWILQDTAREDVQAAVRQAGAAGDSRGVQELRANLTEPILRELRELMGEDGYAAYNRYQLTSMFRMGFVNRMQPVLASAGAAVSEAQADQMVAVLTTSFGTKRNDPTSLGGQLQVDWDAVAQKSAAFLTPAQQAALQSFIAQEKARGR